VGSTDGLAGVQAPGAGSPPDSGPPPVSDAAAGRACVLVVDDDELNRALMRTMLARSADPILSGARLVEAADLAQARAALAACAVDLVLLDLRLPDGSGITLASELKQLGRHDSPAVIALSGAIEQRQRTAAFEAGCAAVLTKPYPVADLRELLTAHLGRRAAQSRGAAAAAGSGRSASMSSNLTGGFPVTAEGSLGETQTSPAPWPGAGAEPDFRTLFESAPGSYLVLNGDLGIVGVSDAYLRDTTTSRADIVGRGIFDILSGSSGDPDGTGAADLRASLERVRHDRVPDAMAVQKYDIRRPESQGGGIGVGYRSRVNSPAVDAQGRLAYIIHRVEDVTEYVQLQQRGSEQQALIEQLRLRADQIEAGHLIRSRELQEANQALRADNEAQSLFLSRVSHELRTPLNTILGFGELLGFSDITAEHREWMSMMLKAAQHLLRLLDEVLDISRTEADQLSLSIEAVSVQDVIADALEIIRPLAISRGVHLDPPPVLQVSQYAAADLQRLRQVLINLLSNAVKYNHPTGTVTVTVDGGPGGTLRISVTDTGLGIPEDQLNELFVPFERLDAAQAGIEGTGLGLALSRQLVQKMGGETGVASTPGQGSTFWIELPATEPIAVTQAAIGHDPIVAIRTYAAPKTVLYIEDMVENLRLIEQVLKQRPSTTLIPAMLGGAALELARQHRPDLILLDAHLPDISGQDLIGQLIADPATRNIPIIILSADVTPAYIDQLLAAGATTYLTKPIRVRQLLQTVDGVLDMHTPEPAPSARTPGITQKYLDSPGGSGS
jgi:signal transduction histidine kinase/DNA-binding response OmpR family regulator